MALTRYHARMQRLDAVEEVHTARIRAALLRQAETAVAMLLQFDVLPGEAGIQLIAARISSQWLITPLEALYVAAGMPEARQEYEHLTGGPKKALAPPEVIMGWAGRLRRFISTEGAAAVRGITERTRAIVRDVLNESAAAGHGISTAAARLRERVAELAPGRARAITRTELVGAANYGSLLGAQATGLNLDTFWIATPGPRTRPEHQRANRQVAANGLFTVGGEPCRYPGDPMLSAGMRVNCRCSIGYKPRE
jgi:hypothetical protein